MAPIKNKALLNVDMGEAYGNFKCGPDDELFPFIDLANIACGFHAGDPLVMAKTVRACKEYNILPGAHPGLPDIQGFGRRAMSLSLEEHTANVVYQVGALQGFLNQEGMKLHHVKPHGMLYHLCCEDLQIARAVVAGIPKGIPLVGLAGSHMETASKETGQPFWAELFGDVRYTDEGELIMERKRRAWNLEDVTKHVEQQVGDCSVTSINGKKVNFDIKDDVPITICCHSDVPDSVNIIKTVRQAIDKFNTQMGY